MDITRKQWFWYIISFITGLAGLGLEISASRLLAPSFGTSTIVWSSVIATVLLALSAGYYAGGRLAERTLSERLLLLIICSAGILTSCIPLFAPALLGVFNKQIIGEHTALLLVGGSLASAILLFGVPVFLLGLVSPYLLALMIQKFGHVGTSVGKLLAISTLGGLAGTFLPTLILIPWIGTRWTIALLGGTLVAAGLPALKYKLHAASVAALLAFISFGNYTRSTHSPTLLASKESPYQHIAITSPRPGITYMQFDAGFGVESIYNTHGLATGFYYDYASLLPSLIKPYEHAPLKVLIIGLAGGTIPRQLQAIYGDKVKIDAVEIDPVSTQLAKQYMGLGTVPLRIFQQDGRPFITHSNAKYDFIYVDAYQNELQIPWPVTTKEFWQSVQSHLSPQGIAAMNVAALGSRKSALVQALANTEAAVFSFVYKVELEDRRSASNLLIMSNHQLDFAPLLTTDVVPAELSSAATHLAKNYVHIKHDDSILVLTDDKAPLEWLMASDAIRN